MHGTFHTRDLISVTPDLRLDPLRAYRLRGLPRMIDFTEITRMKE